MNDRLPSLSAQQSSAEDLYQDMLRAAEHARSRQTLAGLWNSLQMMRAAKVVDYSIARVGKFCEQHGGPKSQSIRNSNGAKFRALIEAFANDAGAVTRRTPSKPRSNIDRAIDQIQDLGVRTAIRMTIERARRLERQNDELRSAFKNLSIPAAASPSHGTSALEGGFISPVSSTGSFPPLEALHLEAVAKFISDEWIQSRFWSISNDGSIVEEVSGSALIAPPGFVNALRRILGHGAPTEQ
ncbi:MAG TPA: gamma-mobile-trio protein GmtX [Terrimicrobiaceae bacterium]